MELNIKYFDPASIPDGAVVLVIGRRKSGKSTMCADLLSYRRGTKRGVCVSATERSNKFWGEHIPGCFIHYDYDPDITKNLFKMQKKVKKEVGHSENCFAVFDDLMFDKRFVKDKTTRKIFMNGRHDKIYTLITCQYVMSVPPDLRANVDVVICMRDNIRRNREKLYENFAGVFDSFAVFDECFKQITNGYDAMVINQACLSYNIEDSVFFYKATPDLQYKLGSSEYWRFSQENPNVNGLGQIMGGDDEDSDEETVQARKKRKAKPTVKKHYPVQQEARSDYGSRYKSLLRQSRGF